MTSTRTERHFKKMPLLQTRIRRLKDSNLVLHQTIISDVRPIEYYEAVIDTANRSMETSIENITDEPGSA